MNRYLTSADRALIARITDLAIDVTAQGRYIADAFYLGENSSLTVRVERRRAKKETDDTYTVASTFRHAITLPEGPEPVEFIHDRTQSLAQITRFLESLLDTPEAPTC